MQVGRLRDGRAKFCSWAWLSAGAGHHCVTNPWDAVPVSTRARLAGSVLAGLRVVSLRSSGGCSCGVVGLRCLGRLMVGLVCMGSIALLLVVVPPHVVYAAGMSVSVLVSGVMVCPSAVLCSLLPLVGCVCIGCVVVFCCVRGYDRRWAWRTTMLPTRWAPFPFRPVHAWLVWCWPACVWSVYGQVAAAGAVLVVRGRLGCLMVGLVCVGYIALLPVVVPPHVVYAAGMSVSVLVSGRGLSKCSVVSFVTVRWSRLYWQRCGVLLCSWVRSTALLPTRWAPFPFRPVHAWLVRRWPACVWSVYGQVVAAAVVWLVRGCRGRLMVGRVRVGSVTLLRVVLSSNPARLASKFVSAWVCGVLVCTSVV